MARLLLVTLAAVLMSCGTVFETNSSEMETSVPAVTQESFPEKKHIPSREYSTTPAPELPTESPSQAPSFPDADTVMLDELNISTDFMYLNEQELGLSFTDWLRQLPDQSIADTATHFDEQRNTLNLTQNTSLSFASFQMKYPITIRTHGHNLILAGADLENIHVDTTHPKKTSGSLYVFTQSHSTPTFRVEGTSGAQGADGDCGPHVKTCVVVSDDTSRTIIPMPDIEWIEKPLRQDIPWTSDQWDRDLKDKIERQLFALTPSFNATDLCDTSMSAALHGSRVSFEGQIELQQSVRMPVGMASGYAGRGRSAELYLGTTGQRGQDAGNVVIVEMGEVSQSTRTLILGGQGGRGGRNYKSARAAATDRHVVHSKITSENLNLSGLKARVVLSGACAGEVGRRPQSVSRDFLTPLIRQSISMSSGLSLANRELVIEASTEGSDSLLDIPEHQQDGLPGRNGSLLHLTFSSAGAWRMALPKHVLIGP